MTASRVRSSSLVPALAGLCALAVFLPSAASAQLQLRRPTPVIETPSSTNTPVGPAIAVPGVPAVVPAGVTVAPRPLDGAGITVNWLEAVDPDAIGLIGEDQGGFPLTLWRGAQ
ncbi:MAG: hypothetical protein ACKVH1_14365, partial [Alphaproteobacteria bacterium]